MVKGLEIRIAGAGKGKPVVTSEQVAHLVEEPEGVGIP